MSSLKLQQTNSKRKPLKMDRYLIASKQSWEVNHVRVLFYKIEKDEIVHPSKGLVKIICKNLNNSRYRVYEELRSMGFIQLKPKPKG